MERILHLLFTGGNSMSRRGIVREYNCTIFSVIFFCRLVLGTSVAELYQGTRVSPNPGAPAVRSGCLTSTCLNRVLLLLP